MRVVALGIMLLAAAWAPAPRSTGPSGAAIDAAERLQDTARVYRNGLRAGAPTSELERLLRDLERDLERVEAAHAAWTPSVPGESHEVVEAERDAIRRGCLRMHEHLEQLAKVLCSDPDDRGRMTALAIEVGRQAGSCEKSLRAVRHLVSET